VETGCRLPRGSAGDRLHTRGHLRCSPAALPGVDALEAYGTASNSTVSRFIVASGRIGRDELTAGDLRVWLTGHDPITGKERGHQRLSPDADLLLDGTLNHPRSYSIAALRNPELATEFEALQDRLRDRILLTWQTELNARRGHGGLLREEIAHIEVVELQHRRSRALDPHSHRHLWLNIKVLGAEGKWSNLDSRVAMKLLTVVNAEGEPPPAPTPRGSPRSPGTATRSISRARSHNSLAQSAPFRVGRRR